MYITTVYWMRPLLLQDTGANIQVNMHSTFTRGAREAVWTAIYIIDG